MTTSKNQSSRRKFIQLSAASAAALILPSCQNTMTDSTENILIIGAGMAGLAAGKLLHGAGHKVTILEGRDRIGGRIHTSEQWPDAPMDLGASWIHGINRNPITKLADEIDAPRLETDYDDGILFGADGTLQPDRVWNKYEMVEEEIQKAIRQAWKLDEDISIEEAVDRYLDTDSLTADELRHLNLVLNSSLEQEWSGSVSRLSSFNIEDGASFGGEDVIFPEGYSAIPNYLSQGLDIRLNEMVTQISHDAASVTVIAGDKSYTADRAIITLPLGVLKQNVVSFDPPLPVEKQAVIEQLGVGVLNKVYFRFEEAFWQKRPEWFSRLADNRGEWSEWFNLYPYIKKPILLAFNAADFGTHLEGWSDEKIVAEGMAVLRSMFGEESPDPQSVQITRWIADPFAGGSYSFPQVGAPADARSILAEPIGDRLFFAGEATSSNYPATVHGAYLSGEREANRILNL